MTEVAEEARLQALAGLRLLDSPPEERFDRIARLARRMFGVSTALVTLIDEDRQFNKASAGWDGPREIPREDSFCNVPVSENTPLVVADATQDARFRNNRLVTEERGIRFYAGQPLRTSLGVPVGALCIVDEEPRVLSREELQVLGDLAALVETELARSGELDRAREVQANLMPRDRPVIAGYELAGVCLPAGAVGGDYYDWYPVGRGYQMVVADVMGKGVAAALIGASVRAALRGTSRYNDLETSVLRLAQGMEADLADNASFVTLFAARLDPERHRLTYVDAGHGLGGVVRADGEVVALRSDGLPLGAPLLEHWRAESVQLAPGDTFVCVSDGLLDHFEDFDAASAAVRRAVRTSASAEEVVERIVRFSRDHAAVDDVTAVVLRRAAR